MTTPLNDFELSAGLIFFRELNRKVNAGDASPQFERLMSEAASSLLRHAIAEAERFDQATNPDLTNVVPFARRQR